MKELGGSVYAISISDFGTATAVSNRVSRRQAGKWAAQDQQQDQGQAYHEPADQAPPEPAAGVDMDTKLAQLEDHGELKELGVLTEAELETRKSRILDA